MPMAATPSRRFRRESEVLGPGATEPGRGQAFGSLIYKSQRNPMSKISIRAFALVAAILCSNVAYAHPQLRSANPAAGVAAASPKRVRITFSEAVIPQFSGIELRDQTGKLIATGKSEIDPSNKKILVVPVKEQVAPWHAVSDDEEEEVGRWGFQRSLTESRQAAPAACITQAGLSIGILESPTVRKRPRKLTIARPTKKRSTASITIDPRRAARLRRPKSSPPTRRGSLSLRVLGLSHPMSRCYRRCVTIM
jgi:methionine-rich copper-binding protein CopC